MNNSSFHIDYSSSGQILPLHKSTVFKLHDEKQYFRVVPQAEANW